MEAWAKLRCASPSTTAYLRKTYVEYLVQVAADSAAAGPKRSPGRSDMSPTAPGPRGLILRKAQRPSKAERSETFIPAKRPSEHNIGRLRKPVHAGGQVSAALGCLPRCRCGRPAGKRARRIRPSPGSTISSLAPIPWVKGAKHPLTDHGIFLRGRRSRIPCGLTFVRGGWSKIRIRRWTPWRRPRVISVLDADLLWSRPPTGRIAQSRGAGKYDPKDAARGVRGFTSPSNRLVARPVKEANFNGLQLGGGAVLAGSGRQCGLGGASKHLRPRLMDYYQRAANSIRSSRRVGADENTGRIRRCFSRRFKRGWPVRLRRLGEYQQAMTVP